MNIQEKYRTLFDTEETPCLEACEQAEAMGITDPAELILKAPYDWQVWIAGRTRNQAVIKAMMSCIDPVRAELAGNPATAFSEIAQLAITNEWGIQVRIAAREDLAGVVADYLSFSENSRVLRTLARNKRVISFDVILEKLLLSSDPYVIAALISADVYERSKMTGFIRHDSHIVRSAVAEYATEGWMLAELREDTSNEVREMVARNANTPAIELLYLEADENPNVAQAARENLVLR